MKKSLLFFLVMILALAMVVGCTPAEQAAVEEAMTEEKDMMEDSDMTEEKEMAEEKDMSEEVMGTLTEAGYIDLSPEEAKKLIDTTPDLVILDVSPKFAEGHLPGAINHYIGDGSLDDAIPTLDKSKPYLVYCHVDSASIPGATKLVEAGFDPVYRLFGNYSAWVDAGFEVEK